MRYEHATYGRFGVKLGAFGTIYSPEGSKAPDLKVSGANDLIAQFLNPKDCK